ncbi:kinase-like domain-containing protein [Rhizophagus diaphanus]|nr:kinase-like domain-containing protein [Rhizophagus diaphanus] [Rhizophagus sp. MUCL 43196]
MSKISSIKPVAKRKFVTLQSNCSYYSIKTSCQLSEGYTIFVNVYSSTANYKPISVKIDVVGWSEYCIYFKIANSNYNNSNSDRSISSSESHDQLSGDTNFLTNFEIIVCILFSNYENLNIDNRKGKECSLGLIGHCLTENTKTGIKKIDDETFQNQEIYLLKLADYERDENEISRNNGSVSKWVSVKNKDEEFSFKSISNREYQMIIQNQATILKKLHDCNNIIKFYGLVPNGNRWFLVTEWAEYGNLREFYTNHKDRFNLMLKLRMSLDIARGLNFLRTVEIMHHDIRAENILITINDTAKLASRSLNAVTLKQDQNLEQTRYCAPELLKNTNIKYDYKCEVYSFGILLWEIAEEKTPYKNYEDIIEIVNLVGEKYREPFSENSQIPEKFKNLVINAVDHNPELRPEIIEMLEVLNNCFEEYESQFDFSIPSAAVPMLVPFTKFLPLIKEIEDVFYEIVELVEASEHNKRTCKILRNRVYAAESAVRDLKVRDREENRDFFNVHNYFCLQNLSSIISQIRKFILDISQMKSLIKYIKVKNIEKTFKELCGEFNSCINLLSFSIDVKISDELGQLKADQDDFAKYLQEMVSGITVDEKNIGDDTKEVKDYLTDLSNKFSSTVAKVSAMNKTMEKYMNESSYNQKKIDNMFQVHPLKLSNYERDDSEEPRKDGLVTKWYNIKIKDEEFAFKIISGTEGQGLVQNQVAIFKELHDWQNIIKFYGLVSEENKWYLVTEWAEYGNLREFYTNHKDQFDLKLKLRMSLDIARGLNFLRTVEIVHRDIRSENILITLNETAKLANFKLSQKQNLERVRYCSPESLERAPNYKYDYKCEIYSFGILLWEIAEEKIPYQDVNDIFKIIDKIRNKRYREPFSENSQMPEEFKQLETEAVHHDPEFRPKISKIFEVLRSCFKDYCVSYSHSQDSSSSSSSNISNKPSTPKSTQKRAYSICQDAYELLNLPDFESFRYMTLADAMKQHKLYDRRGMPSGDVKTAYRCFEAYANNSNAVKRNQITAKYYKAYYISRGLVEGPPNKDKIVAEILKEVADDEANDHPETKLRYGDCLFNGKGIEKNESEALKYFEKAAEDGFVVAMYNVGKMYYNGIGCTKDIEKAKNYFELAAYNGYEPAITFRNDYNL